MRRLDCDIFIARRMIGFCALYLLWRNLSVNVMSLTLPTREKTAYIASDTIKWLSNFLDSNERVVFLGQTYTSRYQSIPAFHTVL